MMSSNDTISTESELLKRAASLFNEGEPCWVDSFMDNYLHNAELCKNSIGTPDFAWYFNCLLNKIDFCEPRIYGEAKSVYFTKLERLRYDFKAWKRGQTEQMAAKREARRVREKSRQLRLQL